MSSPQERFLDVAAAQCGEILNYTAVGRDAALATRTGQEYFQVLEDTLVGFRLEAWAKSPRARLVKHPRFYLSDTGVTNALTHRLTAASDPLARGRLFEQWVVLECLRLIDYLDLETRCYYWRTNQGAEVDLVFERHGRLVLAVEIKAKRRIAGADLADLLLPDLLLRAARNCAADGNYVVACSAAGVGGNGGPRRQSPWTSAGEGFSLPAEMAGGWRVLFMSELASTAQQQIFGGGVAAYREFLLRTEGAADPLKFQLERRERFFAEFESNRPRARYVADRGAFLRGVRARHPEVGLDRRLLWLIATAKLNQSERFGVGLGELYGKEQDKFETEPERLYVQLQEHYHSRILADVIAMFDLPFPTVPPRFALRTTIRLFVALPHEWTLPLVGASEVVGCVLFRAMRDEGVRLFADDPAVADRIARLYGDILADEVGHVGFIASKLSPRWRAVTRFLAREVAWRSILGSVPELAVLFGRPELQRLLRRPFDVESEVESFGGRAYAAAAL